MPTPSESAEGLIPQLRPHGHSSCPPDLIDRPAQWSRQVLGDIEHAIADVASSSNPHRWLEDRDGALSAPTVSEIGYDDVRGTQPREDSISVAAMTSSTVGSPQSADEEGQQEPSIEISKRSASALNQSFSDRHGILSSRVSNLIHFAQSVS